jgi:hypothetical protein
MLPFVEEVPELLAERGMSTTFRISPERIVQPFVTPQE